MIYLTFALIALATLGHAALWVALVNRWHATGLPRLFIKITTLALYAALVAIPPAILLDYITGHSELNWQHGWQLNWATAYVVFCAAFGAAHLPLWLVQRRGAGRLPAGVERQRMNVVHMVERLGHAPACGLRTQLFSRVPGNQLWHLHVGEYELTLPRLPRALDGLSICHWSDLHLSGRIGREYFEELVRLTNALQVDMIALTGDICDVAACIDWLAPTFGPAEARLGKFFILGNHDLRTRDLDRLRGAMREAGFVDVGGRREALCQGSLLVDGNERPWIDSAPPAYEGNGHASAEPLRILLAHTPDQFAWAAERHYDLMLAGHTHGGQIRFPLIGPVVCPSWHGIKFADGFFQSERTLLHVSRGTASLLPLRLNCPPEMTRLVLRAASGRASA